MQKTLVAQHADWAHNSSQPINVIFGRALYVSLPIFKLQVNLNNADPLRDFLFLNVRQQPACSQDPSSKPVGKELKRRCMPCWQPIWCPVATTPTVLSLHPAPWLRTMNWANGFGKNRRRQWVWCDFARTDSTCFFLVMCLFD